ncbi:Mitogen-activated protein kinase-binding protein 1 [Phlyctochytrium bullatum]|nr:Mitogen-activated protein kinase-binding protein 1 [Phlyctochytrium bullatum]
MNDANRQISARQHFIDTELEKDPRVQAKRRYLKYLVFPQGNEKEKIEWDRIKEELDIPLLAFPAGGILTLYNHRKNKQTAFLISASALANSNNPSSSGDEPTFGAGALPQSSNGRKITAGNAVKPLACVAFAPDGIHLAVGEDQTGHQPRIIIWDYANNTVISELRGHKFGVSAMVFSPNQKYLVSVGVQLRNCTKAVKGMCGVK